MKKIIKKIVNILADMGRTYWYFEGVKYDDEMFVKYYLEVDELNKDAKSYTAEDYVSKLEGMNLTGLKIWQKYVYFRMWLDEKILDKMVSFLYGRINKITCNGEFECVGVEKIWINVIEGIIFIVNSMNGDNMGRKIKKLKKFFNKFN